MKYLLCIILLIALLPVRVLSAEVLQINNSSIVQIGDQNRNYKVKLACINVDPSKEEEAANWLRSELPRHSKINLLPRGSENGILVAKIISLSSENDISESMVSVGLADLICN